MENCHKTDKADPWENLGGFCRWISGYLFLLAISGCASTPPAGGDPLVGEIHPRGQHQQQPPPGIPPTPPANAKTPGVPPIPSTQGPVTNAGLASLSGGRPLAIGNSNTTMASSSNPNPPGGTSSGGPRVIPLSRDNNTPPPVLTTGSVSANQQTNDILQAQLRARGVLAQKQDIVPEGVRFSCMVPSRTNPENIKMYETTARDYATAVQAVLLQIDQQR